MTSDLAAEVGGIVVIAVLIAAVARNRGWNPSLPLLACGIIIDAVDIGPDAPADPELVLIVVLAPLVFGEALSSSIVDLRRVSRPVVALAVGLVVFGAFVVGAMATLVVPSMPLAVALCLGAILAPTDAVAVSATARSAALPRRVVQILEGESLVNDGTALTMLRVCAAAAAAGSVTGPEIVRITFQSVVGGLLVGLVGGAVLVIIARRSRDTTVANGCVLIAPFPIYGGAEALGGSGILAVVVAALALAHATSSAVTYTGRLQAASVWRAITFILQAVAFFLVGLDVPDALKQIGPERQRSLFYVVPAIVAALIVSRFLFVYLMATFSGARRHSPRSWFVIAWGGARGPVSALAAFTLPTTMVGGDPFPDRAYVISITVCVVVSSLVIAPTMAPVARMLHLPVDDDARTVRWVRAALARASLDRLDEIGQRAERTGEPIPPDILDGLRAAGQLRLDAELAAQQQGEESSAGESVRVRSAVALQMVHAEQEELLRLRNQEGLPDSMMRTLQKSLDHRIRALQSAR